jgi:hypothetical protein
MTQRNLIPVAYLRTDPADSAAWLSDARTAVDSFLAPA